MTVSIHHNFLSDREDGKGGGELNKTDLRRKRNYLKCSEERQCPGFF